MRIDRLMFRPAPLGLAVLFALTTSVAAQSHDTKVVSKPAITKPAATKPVAAKPAATTTPAAPTMQSAGSNSIAVTGLTKDNSAATKTALEGLSHTIWRCPACSMTEAAKGTCPMCKKDLVSEKSAVLHNIVLDPDKGTVAFAVAPGQTVRLTEIEAVLSSEKISIPRDKLTLGAGSTLMVNGVATQDAEKKVEAQLKDSKLFDSVTARLMGTGKPAELTIKAGATPATRAKVEEALAKAGPEFKLVDVIWTSPMAASMGSAPKSHG